MVPAINSNRIFIASCFALITTAFSFSIRAGILNKLGTDFHLTAEQLGFINSMAFLGFPIAMILFGALYNLVGPKLIMMIAFLSHMLGIILTITAQGYIGLLISTLFIGFGNGCTEAACNPMIADSYTGSQMNKMLNRFHMWFPGGIVIGSLTSQFMTDINLGWQIQMLIIIVPTVVYGVLFWGQIFPVSNVVTNTTDNFKAMLTPLYGIILIAMAFTAISEFGVNQWVMPIFEKSGVVSPMMILACVTGVMAVGRLLAGPLVHRLNPLRILLVSSLLAITGIYLLSIASGSFLYLAAVVFALGICYFWPTLLGFTAEYIPKAGAFGLSIVGGVGMLSASVCQPVIGKWLDNYRNEMGVATLTGDTLKAAELAAGQATVRNMLLFPICALVIFVALYLWIGNKRPAQISEPAAH